MVTSLKKLLYFPVASYFRFWASIYLKRWMPRIVVITGSSGKTTLLNLIESQIGTKALYSHKANSSYGVPFDILGLQRKNLTLLEWPYLFFSAPFRAFRPKRLDKIYIVEVDSDREGEGEFLATLLRPEVTIWLSCSRTHTMNFDQLVAEKQFLSVETAIAHEFGSLLEKTTRLSIINGDNKYIQNEISRTQNEIRFITEKDCIQYEIKGHHTRFSKKRKTYDVPALVPREVFYSVEATSLLVKHFKFQFDNSFSTFQLPHSRSSVFSGIKNTTIIDSSYNATPDGVSAILAMFEEYEADTKWIVLGDMLELGKEEKEEHARLAKLLIHMRLDKVVLVGPRVIESTLPRLKHASFSVESFEQPRDALNYLKGHAF